MTTETSHGLAAGECSRCHQVMQRGFTHVRSTLGSFLFYGLSWMKLAFVPDAQQVGEVDVLKPGERRVAYRCYRCGLLTVTSSPWSRL
jgi:hypothetical protein